MSNWRKLILILVSAILFVTLHGCAKRVNEINIEDISNFSMLILETGEITNCSKEQIGCFVTAYNKSTYFSDDVGTTHPYRVCIEFIDGKQLSVWGGEAHFQTQTIDEKQNNIKGSELENWFEDFKSY